MIKVISLKPGETWLPASGNGGHTNRGSVPMTYSVPADEPGEVLNVHPDGARKFDGEKPMLGLIPSAALLEEGKVWTFGAKKYDQWNWTKGIKYVRIISALMRHTAAIAAGEDRDPESGCLHAAHIRCCAAMLIEFTQNNRTDLDDRCNK